jgi:hypothetical protein
MKCREFQSLASQYLDGQLPGDRARKYLDHISACVDCRGHLAEIKSISSMLRRMSLPETPRELHSYIMKPIKQRAAGQLGLAGRAMERIMGLNPKPVSYLAGALASLMLFAATLAGLKPISPALGRISDPGFIPIITGSDAEYHTYNDLPPNGSESDSHSYELPRIVNDSPLISFSYIAYNKAGEDGAAALVEVLPDGRARILQVLEKPNDPNLVYWLAHSLSKRSFQPAFISGQAVTTRIIFRVHKIDVIG